MSIALSVPAPFDNIKPSLTEALFLRTIGLAPWSTTTGVEVHIGDVKPFADWESPSKDTTVSLFAYPMPALSYRFEILRPSEGNEGMERVTIQSGSGVALPDLWATVLSIASHSLAVSSPRPVLGSGMNNEQSAFEAIRPGALIPYRSGLGSTAWYITEPDAPGVFALVYEARSMTIPLAPAFEKLTFALFDGSVDKPLGSIDIDGRPGLNQWYLQHVGHEPDKDLGGERPITELIVDVAAHIMLRYVEEGLKPGPSNSMNK